MNKLTKHTSFLELKQSVTLTKAAVRKNSLKSTSELEKFFSVLQKNLAKTRKTKI